MANPQLDALLAVQADDAAIREIEARRAALTPTLQRLHVAERRAAEELARTEAALQRDSVKLREVEGRVTDARLRQQRSEALLAGAEKIRDATAAASQLEQARRTLVTEEAEQQALARRVSDLRTAVAAHRDALQSATTAHAAAQQEIAADLAAIDAELEVARRKRQVAADGVPRALLQKYEKVSARRRTDVVIALRDFSCGACDTAIPLQRRPFFSSGTLIEPCEGCGVLLYQAPPVASDAS